MRNYYKYYVAYETYDPSVLPDTPQWNVFNTLENANNNGMSPLFGGNIVVAPIWLRLDPRDDFVSFANGTRLLGLFGNLYKPDAPEGTFNGFWYFEEDLREKGQNSAVEFTEDTGQSIAAPRGGRGGIEVGVAATFTLEQYLGIIYADLLRRGQTTAAFQVQTLLRRFLRGELTVKQTLDILANLVSIVVGG